MYRDTVTSRRLITCTTTDGGRVSIYVDKILYVRSRMDGQNEVGADIYVHTGNTPHLIEVENTFQQISDALKS